MQGGAPKPLALRRPVPVTPAQVMPVFPGCQVDFLLVATTAGHHAISLCLLIPERRFRQSIATWSVFADW